MSRPHDPAFEDWIGRAKAATGDEMLAVAQRLGAQVKRAGGAEWVGPCCACGGRDRFSINPKRAVWNCRGAGGGHDAIGMVMHIAACDFLAACEEITGEPPPRGEGRRMDPEVARERRQERAPARLQQAQQQKNERTKRMAKAADIWAAGRQIMGTWADAYLKARGITLRPDQADDLRFSPAEKYWGYADDQTDEMTEFGAFPCMLGAIRDVGGNLIGVHHTYLDPQAPKKLQPGGDARRNKAKKIKGNADGGMIRLGMIEPVVAIGEGIETTLAWGLLGLGPSDLSLLAGVSLGNLAGRATGSVPHPSIAGRAIPNGEPDMSAPGLVLPDVVEEVILLGDGDSDPAATRSTLLTAARRFRALGKRVSIHMAPHGGDWNDVLIDQMAAA